MKNYELKEENKNLKQNNDDKLYKLKEILDFYPMLTVYSVNKAVNEKKLIATQLGKTRYYRKKDIEKFLENNRRSDYFGDIKYR